MSPGGAVRARQRYRAEQQDPRSGGEGTWGPKSGASLETLARRGRISKNMLSLIERGKANRSWSMVEGIAGPLGVSVGCSPASLSQKK